MLRKLGWLCSFVFIALTGVNGNDGLTELYSKILKGHNYLVPPGSSNISVSVKMDLLNILQMDERNQEMTFTAIIHLNWSDSSLSWNPKEFSHVNRVTFPSDKIWTPDIVIWNSNSKNIQVAGGDLFISADGQVHWPIFGHFKTSCTVDVTYYPFDQQTCVAKIGPTDRAVRFGLYENSINLELFYMSVLWDVIEAPAYANVYQTDGVDFPETDVTYYLIIRRRTHWFSQVFPLLAFAFMTIISAVVTRPMEKLILQVFCIAGLFALHTDLMKTLPPTSLVTPLCTKYIVTLICCNLLHLALTSVINCRRGCFQWIVQQIPFERVTKRISRTTDNSDDEEENAVKQETEKNLSSERQTNIVTIFNWIILALLIVAVAASTLNFMFNHPH